MTQHELIGEYFEWLFDMVCRHRHIEPFTYRKLISHLHTIKFRYSIQRDQNREEDGRDLRYRFDLEYGYEGTAEEPLNALLGPCSVLEMMVALALICEEKIMDDPRYGNRTGQWFWNMIVSLGLGSMNDYNYDRRKVDDIIERFLNRDYEPNGKGGLFTVRHCDRDLRTVEIWNQLCCYLDSILEL